MIDNLLSIWRTAHTKMIMEYKVAARFNLDTYSLRLSAARSLVGLSKSKAYQTPVYTFPLADTQDDNSPFLRVNIDAR